MAWHPSTIVRILAPVALLSCGGGAKPVEEPKSDVATVAKPPPPVQETEEDREKKRHAASVELVPEGSTCLPAAAHNDNALHLELSAIDSDAVVCAIDQDRTRLLGPVACWNVDVRDPAKPGALTPRPAGPLPGRGFSVMFDDRCARGFCLPMDAKVPADPVAMIAWNSTSTKVAVLAGDSVHLFDATSKAHESSFSIRGEKGVPSDPTAIHWNGDALFVEAGDATQSAVYVFRPDGTPVGPIEALGGKPKTPLSTRNGSFMLLDKARVAISEQGLSSLTIYDETEGGKRTKLVRKLPAGPCKKEELDSYWRDPAAQLSNKCKDYVEVNFEHLKGVDGVAGTKNFLMLLRGPRAGELVVIDSKNLAERKAIKMQWCNSDAPAEKASAAAPPPAPAPTAAAAPAMPTPKPAKSAKKGAKPKDDDALKDDPDTGGQ